MAKNPTPEEKLADKVDLCITDGIIKTGSGILLGTLTSVLFLKRKRWPIIAGMGMGLGIAFANCQSELGSKVACAPSTVSSSKAQTR